MEQFTISTENLASIKDVISVYASVGWGKEDQYSESIMKRTIANTTGVYYAYAESKLVGILRLFSDGVHDTYLVDVAVSPSVQRMGIGSALIKAAVKDYSHTAIYAPTFKTSYDLVRSLGFSDNDKFRMLVRAPGHDKNLEC